MTTSTNRVWIQCSYSDTLHWMNIMQTDFHRLRMEISTSQKLITSNEIWRKHTKLKASTITNQLIWLSILSPSPGNSKQVWFTVAETLNLQPVFTMSPKSEPHWIFTCQALLRQDNNNPPELNCFYCTYGGWIGCSLPSCSGVINVQKQPLKSIQPGKWNSE